MAILTKQQVEEIVDYCVTHGVTEKSRLKDLGYEVTNMFSLKKKYGIPTATRGKSPGSKLLPRKYVVNDVYFSNPASLTSAYYAGFIAADGNVAGNRLTIGLAAKDADHLTAFREEIRATNPIYSYLTRNKFPSVYFSVRSKQIVQDLLTNYNITERKSLTLSPPPLTDPNLIDAFVLGYLDGDGCVGLRKYKHKSREILSISCLGTYEMCTWLIVQFQRILNTEVPIKVYKIHENNTFCIIITSRRARKLFAHFYNLPVPKLVRKWTAAIYEDCVNWKKYQNLQKHAYVYDLKQTGLYDGEVGRVFDMSYAGVNWYTRQKDYVTGYKDMSPIPLPWDVILTKLSFLSKESADLDAEVVSIEDEN